MGEPLGRCLGEPPQGRKFKGNLSGGTYGRGSGGTAGGNQQCPAFNKLSKNPLSYLKVTLS